MNQIPNAAQPATEAQRNGQRIKWIDCAKFVAIIAVVVDHTNGYAFTNHMIAQASYFSIGLFVLLSGVSTWLASQKTGGGVTFSSQLKRIFKLFLQYALAVFVLQFTKYRHFNLTTYLDEIIHFTGATAHYFFLFFFQLMLVAPILVRWFVFCNSRKRRQLWHGLTVVLLGLFAALSIQYTNTLPVYGGGEFLLGGTYVILYYLGILFAGSGVFERTRKQRYVILIASACAWITWWRLFSANKLPFDRLLAFAWGDGFNPPSVNFMVFALITLFLLHALFSLLETAASGVVRKTVGVTATAGQYTLYVYLYHLPVMRILLRLFPVLASNMWLFRFFAFIPMILLPIMLAMGIKSVYRKLCVAVAQARQE